MTSRRQFLFTAAAAPFSLLQGAKRPIQHRIWSSRADSASILKNGPEGRNRRRPKPPFAFIEEDVGGTNPKMKVRDAAGTTWNVKWAKEVHAETFASRLAAAAGYFVRPTYYVPAGRISGCEDLTRAKDYIGPGGSFESAVFKLIPADQPYVAARNWSWTYNPFLESPEGLRQIKGLRIMLMLTSNWDAKDARDADSGSNTAIYEVKRVGGVEYRYAFDDWGGSMGRWGTVFTRSKWDAAGYHEQSSNFVQGVDDDGFVEWGYSGKNGDDLKKDIYPADVAWLLQSIGHITDVQIASALVDAGAGNVEVETYTRALRTRLTQLRQVAAAV